MLQPKYSDSQKHTLGGLAAHKPSHPVTSSDKVHRNTGYRATYAAQETVRRQHMKKLIFAARQPPPSRAEVLRAGGSRAQGGISVKCNHTTCRHKQLKLSTIPHSQRALVCVSVTALDFFSKTTDAAQHPSQQQPWTSRRPSLHALPQQQPTTKIRRA